MSLLKKIVGAVRSVAPVLGTVVGGIYGGTGGAALGGKIGSALQKAPAPSSAALPQLASYSSAAAPGGPMTMMAAFPSLPSIGGAIARVLPGAGAVGTMAVRGASTVWRSANTYCRRNPAWCAQIGGTAAIAAMIQQGQLPPIRRRRGRGISGTEFRAFRRVHKVLSTFCAPRMKIRRKGGRACP